MWLKRGKCNKVSTKVSTIDTSEFVLKTKYNTDSDILSAGKKINEAAKKKIPSRMLKNRLECNAIQDNEMEGKISSIIKLATTAALNVAEKKISKVSGIAKEKLTLMQK